jgi:hypothetical protein
MTDITPTQEDVDAYWKLEDFIGQPPRADKEGFVPCAGMVIFARHRQAAMASVIAHATSVIIDVRARNAGNFERSGAAWEAYDKAVLDCHEAVAALTERES